MHRRGASWLHPEWRGNALLVGGPGQGKSTLLQYVCQFHRARLLKKEEYTGEAQQLSQLTQVERVPIRLDLRNYAIWASRAQKAGKSDRGQYAANPRKGKEHGAPNGRLRPTIEEYIAAQITGTVAVGNSRLKTWFSSYPRAPSSSH